MSNSIKSIALFPSLFLSGALYAQSSLDAHVHGEAELAIAIESSRVEFELRSPTANIFGFEHAPTNDEQRNQIHKAEVLLETAASMFEISGATCESTLIDVDLPFGHEHESEHQDHQEHAAEHEDHEDHEDHHDHASEHVEDDNHEHAEGHTEEHHHEKHSEVTARYVFECNSDYIEQIGAVFLTDFPAIESLKVLWITSSGQGSSELSAGKQWIDLR